MRKRYLSFIGWALLLPVSMVLAWQSPALSMEWEFTKIVDTDTTVPEREVPFLGFSINSPSLDDGNVVFWGGFHDAAGQLGGGLYAYVGGILKLVADLNTIVPGTSEPFQSIKMLPSMGGRHSAFVGSTSPHHYDSGVYKEVYGQLHVVADPGTPIPEGVGNFDGFRMGAASMDSGVIAFNGGGENGQAGIYVEEGGGLKKVADTNTPIPQGTGNFTGFDIPCTDKGNIVFWGSGQDGQEGIYKRIGSTLYRVADKNTPIPGGSGNFFEFSGGMTISGENVAFAAWGDSGQEGIYKEVGGKLYKVADDDTQIPGGTGSFADFYNVTPSIDGKWVVFTGRDNAHQLGIYTDYSGNLQKIVDENDLIDGKPFYGVTASRESFDRDVIVITVAFEDSSKALYLVRPKSGRNGDVTVPAFGALGILFLVLIIAGAGWVLVGKRGRVV